jgi:S1-C subfamily serine protease
MIHQGLSPLFILVLGIGGSIALLLVVLIVVLMRGGSGEGIARRTNQPEIAAAPAAPPAPAAVAQPGSTLSFRTPASSSTDEASSATSTSSLGGGASDVVKRLKDATVYIKIKVNNRPIGSGSGFVIETQGNNVLVATNRHVAVPDLDELPERIAPKGATHSLEAVFRSGLRGEEQTLPAQLIAADSTGDMATDLAFLVVQGVRRPPNAINPLLKMEPVEGMPYVAAGFPLGELLSRVAEAKGNPSVTITSGRLASLRRDDAGQLALLQVDGSLTHGNSGGPIVDEKTCKLLGVVVGGIEKVSTIGFIIPAEQVRRCLAGRVGAIDLTLQEIQENFAALQIKAQVVDPKKGVQAVLVHAGAAASVGAVNPNADGSWPPLPNTTGVELHRDPSTSSASGRVNVNLSGQGKESRKVLIQTAHRDTRGQLVYSKPKEYELPEKPGRIRPPGALEHLMKVARRKSAAMLGPLIDPEKDCHLEKNDETYKIKIEIPGKIHTLAPYVVSRLNKKKPLHNAPRTLAEVEGDFVALVEVTGEISAGSKLPKDRQNNTLPFTFQGAGLLLYQDKDNFVRLERTAGVGLESLQTVHKALIEIVKDGKQLELTNFYWPVPEGNTLLIMIRRKGKVRFQFRSSSSPATYTSPEFELDLPKKVQVGLSAANISAKPFTATFENFSIINDVTTIDDEFGDPAAKPAG